MTIARCKKQGNQCLVEMFGVVRGHVVNLGSFRADSKRELEQTTEFFTYVLGRE